MAGCFTGSLLACTLSMFTATKKHSACCAPSYLCVCLCGSCACIILNVCMWTSCLQQQHAGQPTWRGRLGGMAAAAAPLLCADSSWQAGVQQAWGRTGPRRCVCVGYRAGGGGVGVVLWERPFVVGGGWRVVNRATDILVRSVFHHACPLSPTFQPLLPQPPPLLCPSNFSPQTSPPIILQASWP